MSSTVARPTPHGGHAKAGPRAWAALAVLTLPVLLISVDMTVLGFAVPFLSEELRPSSSQLLWIIDIYSFVLAGLLVTMGTLGDRVGRRRLLMVGSAGFGVASLVAAYASSAEVLIAARALLGLAGATLMPSTLSLIRNIFLDPRQRLIAIAAWGTMFSGGAALGPILGGWLLEHFHWGSVFLINLPVMALILVLTPFLVPESRDPAPGRYDLPSAALSLVAVLPVVYGVKQLASGEGTAATAVWIAAGLLLGWAFVRRQLRLDSPMLDMRLFTIRTFSVGVATNLMVVFAMVSSLFFLTQYVQLVLGIGPLRAGLLLLPGLGLTMAGHFVAVSLARRLSLGTMIALGLSLTALGFLVLTRLPLEDGAVWVAAGFALIGTGVGVAETLTNDAIMTAAPPERAGSASAVSETAYELGGALGIAVLGSVLTAVYRLELAVVPDVDPAAAAAARETLGGAATVSRELGGTAGEALMAAARTAFTDGVHVTSLLGAAIVVYAAVQAGVLLRGSGPHVAEEDAPKAP
ncbi:MFS transporter [Actinorugispora endophytica]|uniref:DHA2 family multidrug resistance protein-like MFS transporter n=1 Tax=Actinorugispora endophytica TaxID=1605990 RepID=A0A4V3D8G3_9ACTN|nr:MFS transporter [Actinorugispora endophytica]TDQ51637.1 DHA2 family multidrug resistance protein-like MFS transporter [Actinorugispora endophytica]